MLLWQNVNKNNPKEERRREPRFACSELLLISFELDTQQHACVAVVQDVSLSGWRLLVHRAIPVGGLVKLGKSLDCRTGVVRHCTSREDGQFVIGLQVVERYVFGDPAA